MARIHRKTSMTNLTDLSDINQLISVESLTYEDAFNIIRDYIQLASNKPYTDISITYAYLDILRVIEKVEARIKKQNL